MTRTQTAPRPLRSRGLLVASAALVLIPSTAEATEYFVSTSGSDASAGTSQMTAWRTIGHAASQVGPGDTVHVKAGNYGNDRLDVNTNGTAGAPIVFAGYQDEPGDSPEVSWSYPGQTAADPGVMPLIDGGNRSAGIGIDLGGRSHVEVRNFQIQGVRHGVLASSASHVVIENVIALNLGDLNADYSGVGIKVGSQGADSEIRGCIVYNAGAEAFSIAGDRIKLIDSRVYADDNSTGTKSATDYYIIIDGHENTVEGNYIERVGDLDHNGHGIGVKTDGEGNLFRGNTVVNLSGSLYVRHRGAKNNLFEDNEVIGGWAAILIRDGASNNTFTRTHATGVNAAVVYADTTEDGGTQWAGNDNVISSSLFEQMHCLVNFTSWSEASPAFDNLMVNLTVVGADVLGCGDRENYGNVLRNSILVDIGGFEQGSVPVDLTLETNALWNVGFSAVGETNMEVEPGFVDAAGGDYHLRADAAVIDIASEQGAPPLDLDGIDRPWGDGYDLGAYEYFETGEGEGDEDGSASESDGGPGGVDDSGDGTTGGATTGDGDATPGATDPTDAATSGAVSGGAIDGGTSGGCRVQGERPTGSGLASFLVLWLLRLRRRASGAVDRAA